MLESDVPRTMKRGSTIVITGNMANKYFKKIYKNKDNYVESHGFIILNKFDKCESQYKKYCHTTDGGNIKNVPAEIILKKIG